MTTIAIHDPDILDGLDVAAVFVTDAEAYPAEPYSHGGSRGTEFSGTAELVLLRVGGLTLDPEQACEMLGRDAVIAMQDAQAEAAAERLRMGEYA